MLLGKSNNAFARESKAEAEKQLKDVERSIRSVSDFMHKYQPL